jgi:replicative DNA helicase
MTNKPDVPQDENAERGVIGSVLVLPELIDELVGRVSVGDFFYLRCREAWQAMLALQARNEAIDETTVQIELKARGVEGVDDVWLLGCRNLSADSPAAAMKYADTVRQYAVRLRVLRAAHDLAQQATNLARPLDSIMAQHAHTLEGLTGPGRVSTTLAQVYGSTFEQYGKPDTSARLPTGIAELDKLLSGGIKRRKLAVFAARPGVGKTAVLLHSAHALASSGRHIGFVSMEMDDEEISDRLTAIESRVPQVRLRTELSSTEETALARVHSKFTVATFGNAFHLVYDGKMTMERLRGIVATWARQGVGAVFVDYLQQLESGGLFKPSERVGEIGYFSRNLKALAMQHNIAVIAASQLNREVEKRADKKPIMSDLRESGSIENDADIIVLLNRRGLYDEAIDARVLDLDMVKQRAGAPGAVTAWMELETGRVLPARTTTTRFNEL